MTSAIDRALSRTRQASDNARDLILKYGAPLPDVFNSNSAGGYGYLLNAQNQGADRNRYASYRGWVYAAVHALAEEASKHPVMVGKLSKGKIKPSGTKMFSEGSFPYYRQIKMPASARVKAAANELEIISDHELNSVLNRPNPIQYKMQFVYSFVANLCLTGWAYIIGGWTDEGKLEFYSLPSNWIEPDHSKGAFAEFRIINPQTGMIDRDVPPLTRENVAFAYLPNPADPLSALAPAAAQGLAVKVDEKIQTSQVLFFDNAVFPSAIVTIGKNPHPDVPGGVRPRLRPNQRRQVYAAIKKVMGGVANYGNPAIVDGMIESIERLSASQNEIGWERSEKTIRGRILSAFGVHPFILGEEAPGSYAQAYVVDSRFYSRVNVFLDMLSSIMTDFAPPLAESRPKSKSAAKQNKEKKSELLIWWEEAKATDPAMDQALWLAARKNSDISQNELRAKMGLPPDEDSNEGVIDKSTLASVLATAKSVRAGEIDPEQGVAILTGLGLPDDLAKSIAGDGPTEEELSAQQQGRDAMLNGGQDQTGENPDEMAPEDQEFQDAVDEMDEASKSLSQIDRVIKISKNLLCSVE